MATRYLSPRDQAPYFRAPVVTTVNVGQLGGQLVQENADRVALIICPDRGHPFSFNPGQGVSGSRGWRTLAGDPPIQLFHSTSGNLCQAEWWAVSLDAVGGSVTVFEVILDRWPQG